MWAWHKKREFDTLVDIWLTLEKQPQFAFKSPLTPLFQRGEYEVLVFVPPFEKGGLGGIFLRRTHVKKYRTHLYFRSFL